MDNKQPNPLQAVKLTERLQLVIGELKLYTSDGREGGKEGEVEVPHLLAMPSTVLDQTTAALTIQISHCY
jgi:hypothetical protein